MSRAASWAGVASPSMTAPIAARASSIDSVPPSTIVLSAARTRSLHRADSPGRLGRFERLGQAGGRERAGRGVQPGRLALAGPAQEVGQDARAVRRQHRLGMELDALERQRATWRMPMTTRSTSLMAVTRSSGGSVAASTASEW